MLRLNQNNLNEYLKKTEAEQIYMKKINSINMSFTSLLTSIQSVFSTYDYQLSTINASLTVINSSLNNLSNSLLSLSNSYTSYTSFNNSEINSIKIDTSNLYNMITSGGGESYNYWKEFNKLNADTYINYDSSITIDEVEKITYSLNLDNRTSQAGKLSYVIQSNISNDGLSLTENLDRLGLKITNSLPLNGTIKTLDLVACNDSAGCNLSDLVVTKINFYNSLNGYFKSLNLPYMNNFNFGGYTMNTSDGLNMTCQGGNSIISMNDLNIKFSCPDTVKHQTFSAMNDCNITFINNNRISLDPYINDSTLYTNTVVLESMNGKQLYGCRFGNGPLFNYNNNLTFNDLRFIATTWTLKNYGNNILKFDYCNLIKGRLENYGGDNITFKASRCDTNFQNIELVDFRNVSIQNCKGYTYYDTHSLNLSGVRNFTLNNLTMPSMVIHGTISNNTLSVKGVYTHLNIDLSANLNKFYLTNYTANNLNLTLNNAVCSGITNQSVNISGNGGELYGDYTTINTMNLSGCVGLHNVNVSDLTINLNNLNLSDLSFRPYNNVNLGNMSFVDNNSIYFKGMLKLNNPFDNVFGINIDGPNFNAGINDPDVNLLNNGIIQNINYSITSVDMRLSINKVLNANWISNCDNVKLINVQGVNPNNILMGDNNYIFENVCKNNSDVNEVFTLWCDNVYSAGWKSLIDNHKIKPFTYDDTKNLIYLFY